jgi:ABC-type amino acid transport substrate-binding protein
MPTGRIVLLLSVAAILACTPARDDDSDPATVTGEVTEAAPRVATGPMSAPSFREAQAAGEARVVLFYVPSSGFAYEGDDGRLTGVTVELLRDFARFVSDTHGIDLHLEWLAEERWADFYSYVRASEGGVFGIGNVTITEPRREEIAFSPPYLNNVAVLVTHAQLAELGGMDEIPDAFRGLTALPYPGTLHQDRLEAIRARWLPDMPVRPVASNDELVSLLGSDPRYFGYMDVYNYWRARGAGQPLRRHTIGDDASETFGVILPHGSDWTPVMDAFFQADGGYADSDRFRGLLRTHLGEELATLLTGE